jgi:hypothetical protein
VLILALSKRFHDYLLPIRQALDRRVVWLVPAQNNWAQNIAAGDEDVITFGGNLFRPPAGALTIPLEAQWRELAAQFDEFRTILERMRPVSVVMTEGNQTNDEIMARAAQSAGIKSICIQQGWSPIVHAGFRGMRYDVSAPGAGNSLGYCSLIMPVSVFR